MIKINNKIKLVIWDLDETFWGGTLSEGDIIYNQKNHQLIIDLAERGIISSICSKNEESLTLPVLEESGILDYVVSPRISWHPKGAIISQLIDDLGLRPENVLFIDDNLMNIHEAIDFCKDLSVCTPNHINELLSNKWLAGKDDTKLTRLKQYKVLETKLTAQNITGLTNIEFLRNSDVRIAIDLNSMNHFERILEMVERTNQLNFTKLRSSEADLKNQIHHADKSGVVIASDKYGDYGICGFFLIKNGDLVHFLFSCRVLNMYIESFVYSYLKEPHLDIKDPVSGSTSVDFEIDFISIVNTSDMKLPQINEIDQNHKNLIIGGCDLEQTTHYLDQAAYDSYFTYVNKNGIAIHLEHSEFQIQQIHNFDLFQKNVTNFPIDLNFDLKTSLFPNNYNNVIFSPLNDYSRGLYRCKKTGVTIPFDNFNIDWTDSSNWNNLPAHLKYLKKEHLKDLKENWEFLGPIDIKKFKANIEKLSASCKTPMIVLTGSEKNINNPNDSDLGMEIRHNIFNDALRKLSATGTIRLIDIDKEIKTENLNNSIRHYDKLTYKKIASQVAEITSIKYKNPKKIFLLRQKINLFLNFFKSELKNFIKFNS